MPFPIVARSRAYRTPYRSSQNNQEFQRTQKIPTATVGLDRANHVGIVVSDLSASIKFYEALTGTKIENVDQIGGPRMAAVQGLETVLIKYANVHLENLNIDLLQYDDPKPKKASYSGNDISAMHLCFEVDDLDAVYKRMRDAGLESPANRLCSKTAMD